MIHPASDPFHPAWTPGPHLRGDIIKHPAARSLGDTGKMQIESGIIDEDHEIPRLGPQNAPDGAQAPNQRANRG